VDSDARARLPLPYRTVLLAAGLLLAWHLLLQLTVLLLAVVLAVIVALPLDAGATWLERRLRVPRALGAPALMLLAWLGWLKGTVIDAALTGVLTYVGLTLVGLDHALVFAVVTALLETVPYAGPIVAGVLPVATAHLAPGSPRRPTGRACAASSGAQGASGPRTRRTPIPPRPDRSPA